ncbi:MAG: ATP-binding protein [Vampirovibrionia bacterium]|jgi:hypothetical protein
MNKTLEKGYKIFDIRMVLDSMKDSGYKDAAHALAELIDNSIQAGEGLDRTTNVEVICLEKDNLLRDRQSSKIEKIAVYDDASGMSAETLAMALAFGQGTRKGASEGMGKFGMGLPNASISQCDRVDVYSWQDGNIFHTYLDLDEIAEQGYENVPAPQLVNALPEEWTKKIESKILDSGTLVIWSKLERLKWKRHKAFFQNTAFIVGRMYRYFINDKKCQIRMAAYLQGNQDPLYNTLVKPNDPLYLMNNTQAPDYKFSNEAPFILFKEDSIKVSYKNKKTNVKIKASYVRQRVLENGGKFGSTLFGNDCAKNQGISLVRAGRELEMNRSFEIRYDTLERWWGIEISFDPDLDEVFGVTNNKQSATAFKNLSTKELATEEGKSEAELIELLREEGDPRLIISEIADEINSVLGRMRAEIKKQNAGIKAKNEGKEGDRAVEAASKITSEEDSFSLSSLEGQKLTDSEKFKECKDLVDDIYGDIEEKDKKEILASWLGADTKYIFTNEEIRLGHVMFDIAPKAGKIKVAINRSHPVYEHFIKTLEKEKGDLYNVLKLLFLAWGNLEDKCRSDKERDELINLRMSWGLTVKKMINEMLDQ